MPALSFNVFKEKILDGTKTQTIRKHRKRPIKSGDELYLYWHMRRPDCELLKVTKCTRVLIKRWGDMKHDSKLAKRDGFSSLTAFRDYFVRYDPTDETEFAIIHW